MITDDDKKEIFDVVAEACNEFLKTLNQIEKMHNVYVQIDLADIDTTAFGDLFTQYVHSMKIERILIQ